MNPTSKAASDTPRLPSTVVFLDIDGVLQPISSDNRFRHDLDALQDRLVRDVDAGYQELHKHDIAAVQFDWHGVAVNNLKTICAETGAEIVVSSAWREGKTLGMLKLLFRIHDLDRHVVGVTPEIGPRDLEIEAYLVAHPEISRYVILDDRYTRELRARFPHEFVETRTHLDDEILKQALTVLRRRPRRSKKQAVALARFDALLKRDRCLVEVSFDLSDIGLYRRRRGLGSREFLSLLCDAVREAPRLRSLTVRGLRDDFTWDERREEDPVARLERAARENPALKQVDLGDAGSAARR